MMEELLKSYEAKLPGMLLQDFKKEATARNLTKPQAQKVLDYLELQYTQSKIHPGEAIGIITAESFGEPGTQMTLNVFHFAGVAEVSVTQGLPRLIEILDARKEISTPSMEIFLKNTVNKDPKDVKRVAALIKETKLQEIVQEFSINLTKLQIELYFNKALMRDLKITENHVEKVLSETVKGAKVKLHEGTIILKVAAEENELMETYKLKEKVKNIHIKGVKGIVQVLPIKMNNEFVIITSGSNLKEVIEIPDVDETRTVTNDVFEILHVLGVEAARQGIIREASKVIQDQGLDVDIRHIMLIADLMTTRGNVKGITRGGITGEKKSVLARASFETPLKHLVRACLVGEEDELNSVIENVMMNQPVPVGTGLPDLVAKMHDLFKAGSKTSQEKKPAKKEAKEPPKKKKEVKAKEPAKKEEPPKDAQGEKA
jgi:DNA-directed RNA polymerase subunit A"